ncbi:acetyltransferase [Alcanivorax hongdengensis A-11-3]|uniref:Acetyltransferase n=1 Tax=Alcanivorax hongdengensis A-11-3 TaxID=1177179 RepID=L0W974_9GAMM|nr:hypothetical protein [Alcanivorax hongdengensis]EKF73529.1 acetyltransferase [Alcanivorax hongdengensis A-11-3]
MAQDQDKDSQRRLQFSSNRGGARHRVRYVESSAPPAGECRLCVGSLADTPLTVRLRPIREVRPLPMQVPGRLPDNDAQQESP